MNFGQVLDLLKTKGGYIRLPQWNENTKIYIANLNDFTAQCLIVESDKGKIAWVPNMIELLNDNWEYYNNTANLNENNEDDNILQIISLLKQLSHSDIKEKTLNSISFIKYSKISNIFLVQKNIIITYLDSDKEKQYLIRTTNKYYEEIYNIVTKLLKGEFDL